jgi:hypothetical protein
MDLVGRLALAPGRQFQHVRIQQAASSRLRLELSSPAFVSQEIGGAFAEARDVEVGPTPRKLYNKSGGLFSFCWRLQS